MKVSDLIKRDHKGLRTIIPEATIKEVVERLVEYNIGALPVCEEDNGLLVGIISERDILRFCAGEQLGEIEAVEVREVMTTDLIVGGLDDEVESVMQAMTRHRIRHLPIVEESELIGIISIGDVVKAQLDASSVENRFLRNYLST